MPTQLGLGLGVPLNQSTWFNTSAYADLAAIADFSNNQYALPAIRGPVSRQSEGTGFALSGSVVVTGDQHAIALGGATVRWLYPLVGLVNGALYQITVPVHAVSGTGNVTIDIIDFPAQTVTPVAGTPIVLYMTPGRNFDSTYRFVDIATASGLAVTVGTPVLQEVVLTRNAVALGANLAPGTGTNRSIGTGTATYTGGTLTLIGTDGSNTGAYEFPLVTQAGREYRITFTVAGASTFCGLWDQANQGAVIGGTAATRAAGFHTIEFTATDADSYLVFGNTGAGGTSTITGITAQELPATGAYPKRAATFAEWFAFTAASDTARSYVDQSGTWRNSSDGFTNLVRNNSTTGSNSVIFSAGTKTAIVGESGDPGIRCVSTTETTARFPLATVSAGTRYSVAGRIRLDPTWTGTVIIDIGDGTGVDITSQLAAGAERDFSAIVTAGSSGNFLDFFSSGFSGKTQDFVAIQLAPGLVASRPIVTSGDAVFGGVNAPRFDFRNNKRQLRLEGTTVNSYWPSASGGTPGVGFTRTLNAGLAPNGTMTATRLQWSAIGNSFMLGSSGVTNGAGTTWSGAGWVQPLSGTSSGIMQFQIGKADSSQTARVRYDSATDTVSLATSGADVSNGRAYIIERRNGAIRVGVTATFAVSYTPNGFVGGYVAGSTSGNFLVWGGQVEEGPVATDLVETFSSAVTRDIETARFSPLLEAIMQRTAASVVVRGVLTRPATSTGARIIGTDGSTGFVVAESTTTAINSSGTSLQVSGLAANWSNAAFGASSGYDSAGKALTVNNSTVASSTAVIGARTSVYLARDAFVSVYADGLYDFVGISPERLSNATLQALAVPA